MNGSVKQQKQAAGLAARRRAVWAAAGLTLAVLAAAGWWAAGRRQPQPAEPPAAPAPQPAATERPQAAPGRAARPSLKLRKPGLQAGARGGTNSVLRQRVTAAARAAMFPGGTNAAALAPDTPERRLAAEMWERLDEDDHRSVLEAARKLLSAPDEAVRSQVVEALGWVGVSALPELTELLKDPSDEVASDAFAQWKNALQDVDDPSARAKLLDSAMAVTDSDAQLDELIMEYAFLPDDLAARSLAGLIKSGSPAASEAAREQYEFTTGEPYTSDQAMETWIRENVEPEEPDTPAPAPAPAPQ